MPLDPQVRKLLDDLARLGAPPIETLSPEEARANFSARLRVPGPAVAAVEDRAAPGPGGPVPVRIYRPAGEGPRPLLVWQHGGGWVVGDLETADNTCRHLCAAAGCVVASVDYRRAPEAKFPAPLEDCLAALQWAAAHAEELGADPSRLAVGGDSAGGNLAAAAALRARDEGGPAIAFQLLVYPVMDARCDSPSYGENGEGYGLTAAAMRWYWSHYLADEAAGANPLASPLRAPDVSGLPPALVITAQYDPLRDEAEAYAERLRAAGVPAACSRYPGMNHGFFGQSGILDGAARAIEEAASALRSALKP